MKSSIFTNHSSISILQALVSFLFAYHALAANFICDKDLFGIPDPEDCAEAMFWIPYMNIPASASADAKAPGIFAEQQFLQPPFGAITKIPTLRGRLCNYPRSGDTVRARYAISSNLRGDSLARVCSSILCKTLWCR